MEEDALRALCRARLGQVANGTWRLDALIGIGGMAAVYAASKADFSMAAVKMIHPEFIAQTDARKRFLQEAYISKKINHPGTVEVFDHGVHEDGSLFIVMELLVGMTVEAWADKEGGRLGDDEVVSVADQTLAVLEKAHSVGILHRDIKPANLYRVADDRIQVLDFGIAKLREASGQQTQTGLQMGTPAYMAPEQALGQWSAVDERTDLWAVGATMFHLISGQTVHEAETAGEMLVASATREAQSLARVSEAPFALVCLVDRALHREPDKRFQDAVSMRQALAEALEAKPAEQTGRKRGVEHRSRVPSRARKQPAVQPVAAPDRSFSQNHRAVAGLVDLLDASSPSDADVAALQSIFSAIQSALSAKRNYGEEHPEARRRLEIAYRETVEVLAVADDGQFAGLFWQINPYSFHIGDRSLWEPDGWLERIPYQLYADGLRVLGITPGLDEREFREFVQIMTNDPVTERAPEDDVFTLLWEASLDNVIYFGIDSFSDGDQVSKERFESERDQVIAAAKDASDPGATARLHTQHPSAEGSTGLPSQRVLLEFLTSGHEVGVGAETAARVANLTRPEAGGWGAFSSAVKPLDSVVKEALQTELQADVETIDERFAVAVAQAFRESIAIGRSDEVGAPLRAAVEGLAKTAPVDAIGMITSLRDAVVDIGDSDEVEALQSALTTALVSEEALVAIIGEPGREGQDERPHPMAISRLLSLLDGQYVRVVAELLATCWEPMLRTALFRYIEGRAIGQEAAIGDVIVASDDDLDLALELVGVLSRVDTPAAVEAISMSTRSNHPLVRIAALGHMQDYSDEQVRAEVNALLEDDNPQVRLNALQSIERHQLSFVGPALVVRIRAPEFSTLPYEERAGAISALCTLWPDRAEEVCSGLLAATRLVPRTAFEETRELAAHGLGRIAVTDKSLELLERVAAGNRLRNSKRVRRAARAASGVIAARAASPRNTPDYSFDRVTSGSLMACDQREMTYAHRKVTSKDE